MFVGDKKQSITGAGVHLNREQVNKHDDISSKYTTPPVKMIDDRWAGLPV